MFFFDKNSESNDQLKDNFRFKSVKILPKKEQLNAFENDLYDILYGILYGILLRP